MIMERYSQNKKCTLMTKDQGRPVDSWAINTLGIPGVVLMENTGLYYNLGFDTSFSVTLGSPKASYT